MLGEVKNSWVAQVSLWSQFIDMNFNCAEIFKSDSVCNFITGVIQGNANFTLTHMKTALETVLKELLKIPNSDW